MAVILAKVFFSWRVYISCAKGRMVDHGCMGNCRGQHCRLQWVLLQAEGDKDRQTDNTQLKSHQEDTVNDRTVLQTTEHERYWTSRRHIDRHKPS